MSKFIFNKEKFLYFNFKEQNPKNLFIRCVDSRTDPSILFEEKLGNAFTFSTPAAFIKKPMANIEEDPFFITLNIALNVGSIERIVLFPHKFCIGQKYIEKNYNFAPIKERLFLELTNKEEQIITTSVKNIKEYLKIFERKIDIRVCYIDLKTHKTYNYEL